MSGFAVSTVSPSSSRITRSTPCVDGCCGPMFSTIGCTGPDIVSITPVVERISSDISPRLHQQYLISVPHLISAIPLGRVILAQGITLPLVRHQDPRQVRMPLESQSE